MTHGEHCIVSGDSSTIQSCDSAWLGMTRGSNVCDYCPCDSYCPCDGYCSCDPLFLWWLLFLWPIVLVTAIVCVTLLFCSTISTVCLWPYSLRLDFLYPIVQNNRVFHPPSDPFKVFLSFLMNSRVTTSHQELPKSLLDLALRTHVTYLIVLSVGLVTFAQVGWTSLLWCNIKSSLLNTSQTAFKVKKIYAVKKHSSVQAFSDQ